jgi:hypothetical protein
MGKYSIHSMSCILAMIHITEKLECTLAQLGAEIMYACFRPGADQAQADDGLFDPFGDPESTSAEVE